MVRPPVDEPPTFADRVQQLRVPELKILLKECMLPVHGNKQALVDGLLQFCGHLTDREKDGIFRLLHVNDFNVNMDQPVTLPHHLGPVTLVSGGHERAPNRDIPMGYESVRRFPMVDKGLTKVFTLHHLKCYVAESHAEEIGADVVSQVSIDTPKGVRTFQSPDPSAAFYTAVKRALDDSEDLSPEQKAGLLRQAYGISSCGKGIKLMGLDEETCVQKRVQRAADRQHQHGCYRGTMADVACLQRFAHLSKYNSLPVLPPGHRGPPAPHRPALKPWEAPVQVAPLVQPPQVALAPVLEVFFPMWECKEGSILLPPKPIEGGRGRFAVDVRPKAGDTDKYYFVCLKRTREGSLEIGAFPYKLKVHLNDVVMSIPSHFERVDLTKYVKRDINTLRTEVAVLIDRPDHYFAVMRLFPKSEESLKAHVQAEAAFLDKPQAVRHLQDFMGEQDEEVKMNKAIVELNCPISRMRMELPVRGKQCKHVQCFDARWFMTVFEGSRNQRKCTVCQSPISTLKDLVIDGLQVEILQALENDEGALSVHLARDGTWAVAEHEKVEEELEEVDDAFKVMEIAYLKRERKKQDREEEDVGQRAKKPNVGNQRPSEPEVIDVDAEEEEEKEEEEEEAAMRDDDGHPIDEDVGRQDGGNFFNGSGGDFSLEEECEDEPGTGNFDLGSGTRFGPKRDKRD